MTERHPFKSEAEEGVGDLSKGLTVIARTDENHKFGIKLSVVPIAKLVRRGRLPCLEPGDAKGLRHELCWGLAAFLSLDSANLENNNRQTKNTHFLASGPSSEEEVGG